jgi:mannose-1-phosphate guanylyltransferase/mannose-6-phosphate isomerase
MSTVTYQPGEADRRPWGEWRVLSAEPGCVVKRILVNPAARLSLQRHAHRSEHWIVVAGQGLATLDEATIALSPGSTLFIPAGAVHRIANTGDADLMFIEVQTGALLSEDDIERLADDFSRATPARGGSTT